MNDEELNLTWNDSQQAERAREYTPTTNLEKQVRKLMADDAAQQKRTETYYRRLKATDPNLYLDPKMQIQMNKDALALGESYFDSAD